MSWFVGYSPPDHYLDPCWHIEIHFFKTMHLKISTAKFLLFCLGLVVVKETCWICFKSVKIHLALLPIKIFIKMKCWVYMSICTQWRYAGPGTLLYNNINVLNALASWPGVELNSEPRKRQSRALPREQWERPLSFIRIDHITMKES